ncbi:hypothetical protein [Enterococcus gallinarum]|uniref:hypothetical protein n=1 Tax=Enterococcus TaxID=1350 RepID=UPI0018A9C487|nr:hypothetical protein [Enterococcus gallinarum]MCO5475802.1 hypothetical protein [Enterococcus gallinarum]
MQLSEKPTTHKSCKPKRLVFILLPTLIVVVLGLFLNHFNYWPFQGSKIAGVPDGQLVQLENEPDLTSLLLAYGSQLKFNTTATSLTVYFDHYRKGELSAHESVASLTYEQDVSISGYLNFGIAEGQNHLLVKLFSNGAMSQTVTDLSDYDFPLTQEDRQFGAVTTIKNGKVKLEKNKKVPLLYLAEGNDGLKIYDDMANNLAPDNLKTLPNAYLIYLIIK